jgi:low temperature requirement protein LtrA
MSVTAPQPVERDETELEQKVSPLELFFDLVFVFTLTQVTHLMSEEPTWGGLLKGVLVLWVLWWAWAAYAWLTNFVDTDAVRERLLIFVSMAAMLVAALAVPHAFDDDAVLFACAYFVVRFLHLFIFAEANDEVDVAQAIRILARTAVPAPAILIAAAIWLDGDALIAAWIVALAIDLAGPFVFGVRGFRVYASHFAERFGLVIIIALGESIVALGVGLEGVPLDTSVVVPAVLAIVLSGALWWAYFDVVAIVAERAFSRTTGDDRARMARDSYSYLHVPMIAGIVLVALGIKKTVGNIDEPLKQVPAAALFGGVALYYLGHVAFRLRNVHSLNRQRLLAAILCLALIPVADEVDALWALAGAAAIAAAVIVYEAIRFRDARARVRAAAH